MALHSMGTAITHHIPGFLRTPAEAIIGERCYNILIYDLNLSHTECLKYALSKGLGIGIVLGGAIVKVPQMLKIWSTRSARGLSLPAYILETISYAISLAYAARNRFPFSTYGENLFLTIQNVLITLLILYFSGAGGIKGHVGGDRRKALTGLAVVVASAVFLQSENLCPPAILGVLQAATLPISLISKAPQIISNHQNKSTGNLSAFAVFNALLGCVARLFTTKQEVNDAIIFWGFAGAAILNLVIASQMVMYWQAPEAEIRKKRRITEEGLASPDPSSEWGRKLD